MNMPAMPFPMTPPAVKTYAVLWLPDFDVQPLRDEEPFDVL